MMHLVNKELDEQQWTSTSTSTKLVLSFCARAYFFGWTDTDFLLSCHPTLCSFLHLLLPILIQSTSTEKMAEASTNQESLTLEETNKVRVSLGLAPIGGDDGEPDEDEVAEANYAERKENERKAKEAKDIQERIAK